MAGGPGEVAVPNLRELPELDAVDVISENDLTRGTRTEAFDPLVPAGSIISQSPAPGSIVVKETAVDYVVSLGPEPTPTPTPDTHPDANAHPDPGPDADAHPDPGRRPRHPHRRLRPPRHRRAPEAILRRVLG